MASVTEEKGQRCDMDPREVARYRGGFTSLGNGAEDMAQWLKALDVIPGDPGSFPSTHMVALSNL